MRIAVRFAAQARVAAGTAEATVELGPPHTVETLLLRLAAEHDGPLRAMLVGADGRPHPSVLVIVGDQQVRASDPRPLREGDAVSILTPISGG